MEQCPRIDFFSFVGRGSRPLKRAVECLPRKSLFLVERVNGKKMAPFTLDCRIIRLFALFKSFLVNTRVCTVYVRCVWMMVYTCIRLCTIYAMI